MLIYISVINDVTSVFIRKGKMGEFTNLFKNLDSLGEM